MATQLTLKDAMTRLQVIGGWSSNLEGGDVEVLPEGQTQHVQVLTSVSKRTGQGDEDCGEEEEKGVNEVICRLTQKLANLPTSRICSESKVGLCSLASRLTSWF